MHDSLKRCLEDLEERIDPLEERRLLEEWTGFAEGRFEGEVFSPRRQRPAPPRAIWPEIRVNEALEDFDKMALDQFGMCSEALEKADGSVLNVRANYGTCIIPLLFGVEPFLMPEEANTLPSAMPLGETDKIRRLVDAGPPELNAGCAPRVLEMGGRFAAVAREFPKIGEFVYVYHPDLQGPLDICEIVWGSGIFVAFYEEPELVRDFLELATETYTAFLRQWEKIVPFREGCNAHWGMLHAGRIMLREDSATNLSPELVETFVRPRDQNLLEEFGGGAIHFCGRGDHYLPVLSRMEGLRAVHMSQPECNELGTILSHTAARGVNLIGLERASAEKGREENLDFHRRVHSP